jgi:iron complex transport system substrate-binding protein
MHRRTVIKSAPVALATAIGLAATASSAQESTPVVNGTQPDGSWVFTDDRGRTISLSEMPTRIFADTGAGLALWELGIKPVGLVGYVGAIEIPEELADVPFIDLTAAEMDLEQVIAINPDLSVSQAWTAGDANDFGGIDETTLPGFTDIAPTLSILAVVAPVDQSLARFEELAGALGADLAAPDVVANRDAFEVASERVREAAAAKPDLKVMAISPETDTIWIGNPESASDLLFFSQLGVNVYVPETPGAEMSGLWQQISWEEVGQYEVDLYLTDDRGFGLTAEQLVEQPTFANLPAAKAGQIGDWTIEYVPSYRSMTAILDALAESIASSEVVTG